MLFHQGLNYLANCGPYFATAREVRHPLQDNGSATDQSKYRARDASQAATHVYGNACVFRAGERRPMNDPNPKCARCGELKSGKGYTDGRLKHTCGATSREQKDHI